MQIEFLCQQDVAYAAQGNCQRRTVHGLAGDADR